MRRRSKKNGVETRVKNRGSVGGDGGQFHGGADGLPGRVCQQQAKLLSTLHS